MLLSGVFRVGRDFFEKKCVNQNYGNNDRNLFEEKKKEYASRKEEQLEKISKRLETIL